MNTDTNSNHSGGDDDSGSESSGYLPTTEYFNSYFDLNVHEVMLKDKPRTLAYKNAIIANQIDFKNKIVMDVGAGTGILSMFAAKYGEASKVYAIEASPMAKYCEKLIENNGLKEKIVVINKRVEELDDEDIVEGKVDVIVSEWMGFYLLHESMLESVLDARDRWLKSGGVLFPTEGDIVMAPINVQSFMDEKVNCWDDMYGFDFSMFKQHALEQLPSPWVEHLGGDAVVSNPVTIKHIDFNTVSKQHLRNISVRNIQFSFDNQMKTTVIHGFSIWFNCYFIGSTQQTVQLSTAPGQPATHWKQTNILLPMEVDVAGHDHMDVNLKMIQDRHNPRLYDISIDFEDEEEDDQQAIDQDNESDQEEEKELFEGMGMSNHHKGCDCDQCTLIHALVSQQSK